MENERLKQKRNLLFACAKFCIMKIIINFTRTYLKLWCMFVCVFFPSFLLFHSRWFMLLMAYYPKIIFILLNCRFLINIQRKMYFVACLLVNLNVEYFLLNLFAVSNLRILINIFAVKVLFHA